MTSILRTRRGWRAARVVLHSSGAGTSLRFARFFIQAACMIAMGVVIAMTAVP